MLGLAYCLRVTQHLGDDLTDLRRRLGEVETVLAIQSLKARYGELVDGRFSKGRVADATTLARVADEAAGLFTPDAVWDGGPVLGRATGRQAIASRLRAPTVSFARHFFVNPRIIPKGDMATARWEVLSPCKGNDGTSYWMTGYEDDEYVLLDGVWLHRHMKLTTVFMAPVTDGWTSIFT